MAQISREFHVLQLAALTGYSAGYHRKRPKLSTIVAGLVCSEPVPGRLTRTLGDSTIVDSRTRDTSV